MRQKEAVDYAWGQAFNAHLVYSNPYSQNPKTSDSRVLISKSCEATQA